MMTEKLHDKNKIANSPSLIQTKIYQPNIPTKYTNQNIPSKSFCCLCSEFARRDARAPKMTRVKTAMYLNMFDFRKLTPLSAGFKGITVNTIT